MNQQKWSKGFNLGIFFIAFLPFMLYASAIVSGKNWTWAVLIFSILAALTFLIGLVLKENRKDTLNKMYLATPEQAWQIVQDVLHEKSLPFEPTIKHKLYIQTGNVDVSIEIKKNKLGAVVTISPTTLENMPLIESLCAKLDEAFTPRGLY